MPVASFSSLDIWLPNQLLLAVCCSIQSLLTPSGRAILLCPAQQQLSGSSAQLLTFSLLEDSE